MLWSFKSSHIFFTKLNYIVFCGIFSGKNATEDDIIQFCKENMAGFKRPKHVIFGELPKTSTGKIQKFELRTKAKEL